ncbi:MAG: PLP-dependent aminotransferase family protein, partial [Actinomycetota bacterium]|nr:PLP-dependent aminotransferase family protein [Actinomycetota bacterium]
GITLHEQVELGLRELVRAGRLAPGTRLPSSRALASTLGVSRGVVLEAYAQLTAEGYLGASPGAPTRVASAPSAERPPVPASSVEQGAGQRLDPGRPDLASFPRESWLRSLRVALRDASFQTLADADPRGRPELRNVLMDYLVRARGAAPEPEHTLICGGFTQAFAALCRTLRERGVQRIAVEAPGWHRHRLIAESAGLEAIPVPVDGDGVSARALADSRCEAVVLTPAHQYPTGVVLAPERRTALLEWAEDRDGLIVEDDYDSELRYDRVPVGALQGLAPERVCHVGSASQRLAPGVRIGWILSPSWLTGALTYEQAVTGGGGPVLDQLALADFIARGELDRHLRRMRTRYRARREALADAVARELPGAVMTGVAAGLFAPVSFPGVAPEVLAAAAALGIGEPIAPLELDPGRPAAPAPVLLLGFGGYGERSIGDAVAALAGLVIEFPRDARQHRGDRQDLPGGHVRRRAGEDP